MKKIIGIFALSALLFSCDTTDETSLAGRTDTAFFKQAAGSSPVININSTTQESYQLGVAVSYASPEERSITLEVDPSSTAIEGTYEIVDATLNIPANSIQGWVTINGIYDEHIASGSEMLVLNLVDVSGAQTANPSTGQLGVLADQFVVYLERQCTQELFTPTASFTGDYMITTTDSVIGVKLFEDQTVTLSMGATASERQFSAVYVEGLGIGQPAMDFVFNFATCTNVVVTDGQETGLSCGPAVTLGSDSPMFGSYDYTDDTQFIIEGVEFETPTPGCGVNSPNPFTITLTKI